MVCSSLWSYLQALTELLRKVTVLVWTDIQEQAFQTLKQALTSAPVLVLPDFNKPFQVEIDAPVMALGPF